MKLPMGLKDILLLFQEPKKEMTNLLNLVFKVQTNRFMAKNCQNLAEYSSIQ